jgi:glycosyltransferase involved in cell wall biosynthesis
VDILMLSDVYFPRVNGVSSSIRGFARELTRLGHRVTVVAPRYGADDPSGALDAADAFEVIRLDGRRIVFDPEDRLIRADALRAAEDRLARRHWDVIHIHTPFRAHRLGVRLARRTGRPTVETYHTYFEQYAAHYFPWAPPALLRLAARAASRRLCRQVDALIVPSEQMAQVLRGYGIGTPATVLPTGLDLGEFAGGDGERFRRTHAIAPARPTLVTVSRLAAEKNIGFLLEATRILVDSFPDLLLIVAGEGPDAARLKRRSVELGLAGNVRFFGNLDRRGALLDCYKAGDVFVFASPTETQGLVLIEAMALGVPIVSTAVMGTATVLAGAASARISGGDVDEFAGHVAALLRAPHQRHAMAAAGPGDAAAWSAPVLMQRAVELYQRLAQSALAPAGRRHPAPEPAL